MGDVLNANPTVYDVSLLPTRHQKKRSEFLIKKENLLLYSLSLSKDVSNSKTPDSYGIIKKNSEYALGQNFDDEVSSASTDEKTLLSLSLDDSDDDDEEEEEEIDSLEIYDLIANISDPEHPLSLAALGVVNLGDISINYYDPSHKGIAEVVVKITPTINHCSLATLIGLGIRVRLERCLPPRFRISLMLKEGSHQSENQVNKQLNDKERINAACENSQLLSVISNMLSTCT